MDESEPASRSLDFGALLRRHRLAAGLSQEALAERARMSIEGISALERGFRRSPQRETIGLLAGALALDGSERRTFEEAAARSSLQRRAAGASVTVGPWETANSNLPFPVATFIGRERELDEIATLVRNHRLVALTGAGGVGKTQTALRVARILSAESSRAAYFISLAPVGDPALVSASIASILGVQPAPNHPLLDALVAYLRNKPTLLLLDNCEHVKGQLTIVVDALLADCPRIKVLATSREPFRAAEGSRYQLRPLNEEDAMALFVDRAQGVDPHFSLSDGNRPLVAQVCRMLDGIPLAIELAAARINLLSLKALRERLDDRLATLTRGRRTALPQQRTMRATIEWSFDLLSSGERRVFERFSIFSGGCTLAAATAVCAGGCVAEHDVLSNLESLVDKSLLTVDFNDGEPRYALLESFRQYAREKLLRRSEQRTVAQRHAAAYLDLAQELTLLRATDTEIAFRLWFAEQDNLRSALAWALIERYDVSLGQRLAGEICYWEFFAPRERRRWIDAALGLAAETTPVALLAQMYKASAIVSFHLREYQASMEAATTALNHYRALGNQLGIAQVLNALGYALENLRRTDEAKAAFESALPVARAADARTALAGILSGLALVSNDISAIRRYAAEAKQIHEASGNKIGVAFVLLNLGICELRAGNAELALEFETEALAAAGGLPAYSGANVATLALNNISSGLISLARYDEAELRVRQRLELACEYGIDYYVATSLEELVVIDWFRGRIPDPQWCTGAARLLGFVDAFLASVGLRRLETSQPRYDAVISILRDEIGVERTSQLMTDGASLTQEEAIAEIVHA